MKTKHKPLLLVAVLVAVILAPIGTAWADQGFYVIDTSARPGMLMSISANDPNVAEPASESNAPALVGVLGDQPTSFDFQDGQKNVLTGGVRNTLVSTVYGDIKKGDYITASSIQGLGGKLIGSGWVIGIAQDDFSSASSGALPATISEEGANKKEVHVGSIPVLIKVLYYDDSRAIKERDVSFIPESFRRVIDSIAGKRASQVAVILAGLLLVAGLIIGGIIVYSAIKHGIIATARQPLAKQAVAQRMAQSCIIATVIIIVSIFGALVIIRVV